MQQTRSLQHYHSIPWHPIHSSYSIYTTVTISVKKNMSLNKFQIIPYYKRNTDFIHNEKKEREGYDNTAVEGT